MSFKQFGAVLGLTAASFGAMGGMEAANAAAVVRPIGVECPAPVNAAMPVMARAAVEQVVTCVPETTLPPVETTVPATIPAHKTAATTTIPTETSTIPTITEAPATTEQPATKPNPAKTGAKILLYCPVAPTNAKQIDKECKQNVSSYLAGEGFDDTDGRLQTMAAQKVMGFADSDQTGAIGPKTIAAIQSGAGPNIHVFAADHIQAPSKNGLSLVTDQTDELTYIFQDGKLQKVFVVSTGKESTPTENGDFTIQRISDNENKVSMADPEWELYKPIYFNSGKAYHGSVTGGNLDNSKVTGKKASHGCARTSGGMILKLKAMISKQAGIDWNDPANQPSINSKGEIVNPDSFATVTTKKGKKLSTLLAGIKVRFQR